MNGRYALINKLTTRPGRRDEVVENLLEAGGRFQGNPSCLLYLVNADVKDPDVIWVEDLRRLGYERTARPATTPAR